MGGLLGFVPFSGGCAARLAAALAVLWAGLVAVPPADAADVVLLAAGDIASCVSAGDTATAALVAAHQGAVATLGDNVYNTGTAAQFANCYGPTWGRFKARTRPSVGNHEYGTAGAAGYFNYFGAVAGPRGKGWYSYDLGDWHVIVLNSNCTRVGCGKGSEQEQWLRADLAAHSHQCTLAYWHHPRFSSDARHGNSAAVAPFWSALYEYGADLVLGGHAHDYERFAPQDPAGKADPAFGIRQFIVGTGGRSHYGFRGVKANSEVRNSTAFGVLQLTLRAGTYDWRFLPQLGRTFSDSGTGACHDRPAVPPGGPTTSSTTTAPVASSSTTSTVPPPSSSTTSTVPVASSSTTSTLPQTSPRPRRQRRPRAPSTAPTSPATVITTTTTAARNAGTANR